MKGNDLRLEDFLHLAQAMDAADVPTDSRKAYCSYEHYCRVCLAAGVTPTPYEDIPDES